MVAALLTGFTFPTCAVGSQVMTRSEGALNNKVALRKTKPEWWKFVFAAGSLTLNVVGALVGGVCVCRRRKGCIEAASAVAAREHEKELEKLTMVAARGILVSMTVEELRAQASLVGYAVDSSRVTKQMLTEMILAKGGNAYGRVLIAGRAKKIK